MLYVLSNIPGAGRHTSHLPYYERRWKLWLARYFPPSGPVIATHSSAVAFGYFESLLALNDALQIQRELSRIKGMNALLDRVGQQEHLYEIFVDATEQFFSDVLNAVNQGVQDDSFLVDAFNDEYNSSALITHFRVSLPVLFD